MSKLLELRRQLRIQAGELRRKCNHPEEKISIRLDGSCVGCGCSVPSVVVTCTECGSQKMIFNLTPAQRREVKKIIGPQRIGDERLDLYAQYDWELENVVDERRSKWP
ncbi:MAG: hypothetical protein E6R03_00405 [Hyphomicrobiaceae bacterium]|nr:MAG: hypothetical protein E6R03_00405 [Hyphomicrobiaceae bacterium]